jgi:hypothetical protein
LVKKHVADVDDLKAKCDMNDTCLVKQGSDSELETGQFDKRQENWVDAEVHSLNKIIF